MWKKKAHPVRCVLYMTHMKPANTEIVCSFVFVHCTLFAGGKCQEIIKAWKLILNDCHLLAILLLSWEMHSVGMFY